MSDYCFVVSASTGFTPDLTALLNSLEVIGNKHDVHILGYKLPRYFTEQFSKLSYKTILTEATEEEVATSGGVGEFTLRKRYLYAAQWGQTYKATCVLDADMLFVRPVDLYFHIAHKAQIIIGASLEQKRFYGGDQPDHILRDGTKLLETATWNHRDICAAPVFADMTVYCWYFKESWNIYQQGFRANDMDGLNLTFLKHSLTDRILLVSNPQLVSTNEKILKPYIRVVGHPEDPEPGGKLWTETGDPIYIMHGKWYQAAWRKNQYDNRVQCGNGYLGGCEKSNQLAEGAIQTAYSYFKRCLDYCIQVPHEAYTNNGHPDRIGVEINQAVLQ